MLRQRRALWLLLALGLVISTNGCDREPTFRGTSISPALLVPALTFSDSTGTPIVLQNKAGEASLVFFGYTHCPDICPATLSDWVRVKTALGDNAKRVHFVFVTVDPERDTPAVAQQFATQFDATFVGLSGDSATTANVQHAFRVAAVREPSTTAEGYSVGHSARTFLMDDKGRVRVSYRFGAGWDVMADDLKQLVR